jgi:hypothetical protein
MQQAALAGALDAAAKATAKPLLSDRMVANALRQPVDGGDGWSTPLVSEPASVYMLPSEGGPDSKVREAIGWKAVFGKQPGALAAKLGQPAQPRAPQAVTFKNPLHGLRR